MVLREIFNSIKNNESFIFNAGAGSGKTFALIETLKYVIRNNERGLKKHNQKIICITYTNVATREIKERLGNTDLVLVSTIHERIWELIRFYQKELVEIHKEKLEVEIKNLNKKLNSDKGYERYQQLDDNKKETFKNIMIKNKDLFYENYSIKAAHFKEIFESMLTDFPDMLKNVNHFRKTVSTIYKVENYRSCYKNIKLNRKEYKTIKYNSIYNSDLLHKMQISHDTLLDYGLKIIEKYDVLKQIIVDKYPLIFIDEYQDTDEKVVSIMCYLENYAKSIGHKSLIGYFGDTAQNIYDKGVGSKITEIHQDLNYISKEFNRRSTKEIIKVINKIRNDDIVQKSIYDDCEGGSVKFYKGNPGDVREFINKYTRRWHIHSKNQLHCLVLTMYLASRICMIWQLKL